MELKKTLPATSTTFDDAAEELFLAAKKQEYLDKIITKCQGIIRFVVMILEIIIKNTI